MPTIHNCHSHKVTRLSVRPVRVLARRRAHPSWLVEKMMRNFSTARAMKSGDNETNKLASRAVKLVQNYIVAKTTNVAKNRRAWVKPG